MSTIRLQALPKFPASVEAGDGITITRTNGTYVFSADPGAGIFQLADADLTALADNPTNGLLARTGAGTGAARTLTGTANEITVTNGDGVSGAPTFSLPAALVFAGKTIAGGTYAAPIVSGPLTMSADTSGVLTIGRESSGTPWSLIRPDAASTGIEFRTNPGVPQVRIKQSTGDVQLLTGGLVVDSGGTTASGVPPGLSPTPFIGLGAKTATNFRLRQKS